MDRYVYFAGHCMGESAFALIKKILGEQLFALYTGQTLHLPNAL